MFSTMLLLFLLLFFFSFSFVASFPSSPRLAVADVVGVVTENSFEIENSLAKFLFVIFPVFSFFSSLSSFKISSKNSSTLLSPGLGLICPLAPLRKIAYTRIRR